MTQQKLALITGAAGGIGTEVARRLHQQGYRLTLIDIDAKRLKTLADALPGSITMTLDCADRQALAQLTEQIRNGNEAIDIAFINAGIVIPGEAVALTEAEVDLQLEVNLRSAIQLIKACAENMVAHGRGHIVSTVSIGGILALKGNATYAATKFGLRGFLNCLHDELRSKSIHVSGIYPSGVDTGMLRFEARGNGSALNFVSQPRTVEQVGLAFETALRRKSLEVYVPYADGVISRLLALFPWSLHWFYPLMERVGERGRRQYLNKISSHTEPDFQEFRGQ